MNEHVANAAVADVFCEFIEVAFHIILFVRGIYPPELFASTQKYGCPIKTARHPGLISYIEQVTRAIRQELQKDTIQRICFVTLDSAGHAVERFVFEMSVLRPFDNRILNDINMNIDPLLKPKSNKGKERAVDEVDNLYSGDLNNYDQRSDSTASGAKEVPKFGGMMALTTDVETMFRGMLMKLSNCNSRLKPLNDDCSFTIQLEMKALGNGPDPKPGFLWSPINPTVPSEHSKLSASAVPVPPSRKIIPVKTIDVADIQFELFIERMDNI